MENRFIWITTNFEGFHAYPDAPDEVAFLRNRHRHIFYVKIWISVSHDDRDIEFILFKRYIDSLIHDTNSNLKSNASCEMISDMLAEKIQQDYPGRKLYIEISEDLENGSFVEY